LVGSVPGTGLGMCSSGTLSNEPYLAINEAFIALTFLSLSAFQSEKIFGGILDEPLTLMYTPLTLQR